MPIKRICYTKFHKNAELLFGPTSNGGWAYYKSVKDITKPELNGWLRQPCHGYIKYQGKNDHDVIVSRINSYRTSTKKAAEAYLEYVFGPDSPWQGMCDKVTFVTRTDKTICGVMLEGVNNKNPQLLVNALITSRSVNEKPFFADSWYALANCGHFTNEEALFLSSFLSVTSVNKKEVTAQFIPPQGDHCCFNSCNLSLRRLIDKKPFLLKGTFGEGHSYYPNTLIWSPKKHDRHSSVYQSSTHDLQQAQKSLFVSGKYDGAFPVQWAASLVTNRSSGSIPFEVLREYLEKKMKEDYDVVDEKAIGDLYKDLYKITPSIDINPKLTVSERELLEAKKVTEELKDDAEGGAPDEFWFDEYENEYDDDDDDF